ncbi:MAG: amine oxidase, partial [Pseudomonadota bacterium]|nr:amine oxidase [Pseudomonadota bacterium]
FQSNQTVLHGDVSFMPRRRAAWSSWTYLMENRDLDAPDITMSYWMNRLQSLDQRFPLFETLNPSRNPNPALVYDTHEFEHPVFDKAAIDAQARIKQIQGVRQTWYCGAWQRYGFHEDGLWSAVQVAAALDAAPDWTF